MAKNRTATVIFKGDDQISPAIKGATNSVAGLKQGLGTVDDAAKKASDSIRENLVKQIEAAQQKIKSFAAQGLKVEQGQALAEFNKLNRQLKEIDGGAKTAGVSIKEFLNGSTEQARDLTGQLQNLSSIVADVGRNFTQVAEASSQAFLAFDTAKTKVATLSNESDLYANQALKLTGELGNQVTSTEILTAQYEILSSGFTDAADASEIARVSVLGAKAGFTDVATVADATTSVLNAYGLAASDAANVVDQLAVVQDKGKTTIGQYAGVLGKVAPIAASAGVSLKELNAAVASVTINGVKTEAAVSGIRQAIVNLIRPTDSAREALRDIGITNAASTLKTEGLVGVLNRLKDAGFKSSDQLSQIFTDIDGLTAVVPLLNDDLSNFNKNLLALDDASGKAQKGFDDVAASAEGKIATAVNKVNEALVDLGRGVVTSFEPLASAIGNAASVFTSLPAPIKVLVGALIGLTGAALTGTAAIIGLGAVAPAYVQGLALITKVTGGLTIANTGASISFAAIGTSATAAIAGIGGVATASISLTAALGTIGGILAGTAALAGTLAIAAVSAITSIIVAVAPLALALGGIILAFDSVRNTFSLFNEINSNSAEDAFDRILNKAELLDEKLEDTTQTSLSLTDKLAGGFDKVESPLQGAALVITNLANALIGADSGASQFGSSFGLITEQQLKAQKVAIAYGNAITQLNGGFQSSLNIAGRYGAAIDFEKNVTKLSTDEKKKFKEQLTDNIESIKKEIAAIEKLGKVQGVDQELNKGGIKTRKVLLAVSEQKIAILEKEAQAEKKTSEQAEEAVKRRITLEKRALEYSARTRGRDFEAQAKSASTNFEAKARAEKQAFETKLNADKKAFEDSQKSDKKQFEKQLQTEQRSFNDSEKSKDRDFQKSKQDLERAFNQEQQKAKADFNKQQQESSRAFEARQNSEKTKAEGLFAQRRVEIERKLQLDAANTPEDRAKLEAEFKAADEKAALEKAAFAQLKADEEAFALKQQAKKVAFDEAQNLKAQELEAAQQAAKLAFDDAQKLKDLEFEKQKEATKLAFENTLEAKRDTLEVAQNLKKDEFETAQTKKKEEFEDRERKKKDEFETAQTKKKEEFEDRERKKKEKFEDNLKTLEAKFSAEERAKDIATAKQVAAIKNTSSATAKIGAALGVDISPRAKGGRFNAGQQLLVGEQGQEIVTFGNSGFVSTAADTKQILSSNTSAPSSVSTARMEALLTQLVGKLDRPNVSVQTSENPSDVLVKIQREAARAAAMNAGI
jgi:TP901 family phage tail tape measure protein